MEFSDELRVIGFDQREILLQHSAQRWVRSVQIEEVSHYGDAIDALLARPPTADLEHMFLLGLVERSDLPLIAFEIPEMAQVYCGNSVLALISFV